MVALRLKQSCHVVQNDRRLNPRHLTCFCPEGRWAARAFTGPCTQDTEDQGEATQQRHEPESKEPPVPTLWTLLPSPGLGPGAGFHSGKRVTAAETSHAGWARPTVCSPAWGAEDRVGQEEGGRGSGLWTAMAFGLEGTQGGRSLRGSILQHCRCPWATGHTRMLRSCQRILCPLEPEPSAVTAVSDSNTSDAPLGVAGGPQTPPGICL